MSNHHALIHLILTEGLGIDLGKHSDKSKQTCPCLQQSFKPMGRTARSYFDLWGWQISGVWGNSVLLFLASGFITMSETADFWQVVFHLYCELHGDVFKDPLLPGLLCSEYFDFIELRVGYRKFYSRTEGSGLQRTILWRATDLGL